MNYDIQSDVVIAGAGPGGAAVSLFLSKEKIPHVILDKEKFPRDKICGDALSGKVLDILKRYNPQLPELMTSDQNNFTSCFGIKFAAPNGKYIDIAFKDQSGVLKHPPGFTTKRFFFDNYLFNLLNKNFADVCEQSAITDVTPKDDGVEFDFEEDGKKKKGFCKILIGAEGDRSVVAKKLAGYKNDPKHYCGGLRAYYRNVIGFERKENFIEIHFIKDLIPGYLWIFPLPNGEANVGVGMLTEAVSRGKVNLKSAMLDAIRYNPTIKDRFRNAEMIDPVRGWGLSLGSKKRKISGNNFLLVGDAASLIDPFSGEGIGNAMLSGYVAAKHIVRSLKEKNFSETSLKKYEEELYGKIWGELKLSYTMQRLCAYPFMLNLVINKSEKSATLRETLTCMFDDLDMRSRLSNPMFYLKLLFNK